MAFINNYQPEDYSVGNYFDVPDGIHDIKVVEAKVKQSNTGKQMIEITYQCKSCPTVPYYEYYVEGDYFNKNITRFFDAMSIRLGDFNFQAWIGHAGKGMFAHRDETYTDKMGAVKTINKCYLKTLMIPDSNQPAPQQNRPQQQYPQNNGYGNGGWQ
ncbi:MAG: hypothetical protein MJZ25_13160 [Fibrobacter sp.]|nr:hypothetical protein [Fibrobacter sp.]